MASATRSIGVVSGKNSTGTLWSRALTRQRERGKWRAQFWAVLALLGEQSRGIVKLCPVESSQRIAERLKSQTLVKQLCVTIGHYENPPYRQRS